MTAKRVVQGAAFFSTVISLLSLLGWLADSPFLTRWSASSPRMVPATSIGVLLASLGLWWAQRQSALRPAPQPLGPPQLRLPRLERFALPAIGGFLLLLGVLNLILHRPVPTLHEHASPVPVLQMAQGTALALIMLGIGFLLLSLDRASLASLWAIAGLGGGVAIIGLVTVLAILAGTNSAPWWSGFLLQVSLPTAVSCCLLGTGLVSIFFQRASGPLHQFSITAAVVAVLGLLLLFAGGDAAVLTGSTSILNARQVEAKASDQMQSVQKLVASVRQAESGQRGYLLTGDPQYLQDLRPSRQAFEQAVREKTIDDALLLAAMRLKLDELERTSALEDRSRRAAAVLETANGLPLMQQIEARQQAITNRWRKDRAISLAENEQSILAIRKTVLWSYGMAVLFALGALLLIIAEMKRRSLVEAALREAETRIHSELRKETLRAEEASRAKSSFLASMSHEIRTPMNAILGMADMLWETELSQIQRQYVEVFRRAGGNLLTLINDILDLSKIESGNLSLEQVNFDLGELVEQLLEISAPRAEAKGVALTAHIEMGAGLNVMGDPLRLQQVLLNLLGNALKFTERGSVTLLIKSHPTATDSTFLFEISDTGIGIPEDKLTAIFGDFTQAESSVTRRFGGTGLGLSISQRIVHLMGGHLQVRSEWGQGSTFSFSLTLPLDLDQQTSHSGELAEISGKSVLIVDNNSTNRAILGSMCSAWGMLVKTCKSGFEAIEAARIGLDGQPFHLALVDRMMPGMNGFEAALQIRVFQPGIAIFIISSDSLPGDISRCRELGFSGHLLKPVRRAAVLRRILTALSLPADLARGAVSTPLNAVTQTRVKVLAAEDSEDNRFLLKAYCSGTRYEITFALDGDLAVQAFRNNPFDLVLMDIQMPVMDGLTSTRIMRGIERETGRRYTPILAMTANALPEDVIAGRAAGCDAHLAKPISRANFLNALAQWDHKPGVVPSPAVPIEIEAEFEAFARDYLSKRRGELTELHELFRALDFPALARLSHNLKGTGTSYGFPDITRLGIAMEQSSKDGDHAALAHHIAELATYLETAGRQLLVVPIEPLQR